MTPRRAAAIAAGAAIGAGLRWAVLLAFGDGNAQSGILVVNVAGCLALGVFVRLVRENRIHRHADAFLSAGLCGALTTWSTLALQSAVELRDGQWMAPSAWLAANLVLGIAAAAAGRHLGIRRWGPTGAEP